MPDQNPTDPTLNPTAPNQGGSIPPDPTTAAPPAVGSPIPPSPTMPEDVPATFTPPSEAAPPPPMEGSDSPPAPPIVESAGQETGGSAAPAFDIDSSTAPPTPKKKFGGKKVIATILGILVLIGGLGAGIILVQQQQDIRQRAAVTPGDGGGGGGTPTLTPTPTRVPTPPTSTPTQTPSPPPTNECVKAGGQCYTSASCLKLGKSAVNGGSGCGNVSQVCCSPETTPTITPSNACVKAGGQCYKAPNCTFAVGRPAVNGGSGCEDPSYVCCQPGGTTTPAPTTTPSTGVGQCGRVTLDGRNPNSVTLTVTQDMINKCKNICTGTDDPPWINIYAYECNGIGLSAGCQDNGSLWKSRVSAGTYTYTEPSCGTIQIDAGCVNKYGSYGSVAFASKAASTACTTSTTTPPPGITAQCLNVKAYDTNWVILTIDQLKSLKAGDKVRFTVAGTASSGSFDKAKFKINGVERPEVTTKKPGSEEFYDEYTIPEGVTTFTINAQIHHATLGWSN